MCPAPPGDQTLAFQCGKERECPGKARHPVSRCIFFEIGSVPSKNFLLTNLFWRYFSEKEFPESPLCIFNLEFFITSTCNYHVISISIFQ